VIAENTEQVRETNVDGGRLDELVVHRIDENSTRSESLAQTSIRENHGSHRSCFHQVTARAEHSRPRADLDTVASFIGLEPAF
jgi:hypothetical protein